jgi:putative ABC transport system substrate-binding protein
MYTNTMKKILLSGMAIALAACGTSGTDAAAGTSAASSAAAAASQGEEKVYKVAIVKLLDHASLDEIANAITAELDKLAEENGVTIDYGEVYSGQNDATTLQQIATQALSDEVDVIIPIATLAAQTMASAAQDTQTPVVFAAISDPEAAELTDLSYVTGTSDALNTEQIMDMIFLQNPEADSIGLLYSQSEANSTKSITEAKAYLEEKGIAYVEATANTSDEVITAASTLISDGVDAIFTPTDNIIMAAELAIAPTLIEAGIPHYAGADSFVRNGAYATCGVNYTDLGTETADLAYQTMTEGIEATGYAGSYEVMPGGIITVNVETAAALGLDYSVFSSLGTVNEVTTTED